MHCKLTYRRAVKTATIMPTQIRLVALDQLLEMLLDCLKLFPYKAVAAQALLFDRLFL